MRALHSLGVSSDHYGSLLVSVLFKDKLPSDIKLLIGRKLQDQDWTLDNVLKVSHVEIETREKCGLSNPSSDYKKFTTDSLIINGIQLQQLYYPQRKRYRHVLTVMVSMHL